MLTALIALPLAAQVLAFAADQSQFTRPAQQGETMRFREMDRNNDGVITRAEWRGSEQSFRTNDWNNDGILSGDEVRSNATQTDRQSEFDNLDINRNNQIDRNEWRESDDAFRWLDRNNDGVLSRREVVGGRGNARGAAVGTSGRQNCVDNPSRVVDDIYQQVLERPADQASSGMSQALASGRLTVRDIVAQVAKSPEHAQRYYWEPVVSTLYRQMLNRDANQQELRQTASELASGQRTIIDVTARSARRATNNDEDAVKILYRRLLGREADPEGLRGFTELAQRDGIEAVARSMVSSAEYRQRIGTRGATDENAAYEAAVRSLYKHVLGRDPDPVGLQDLTRTAAVSGFDAVIDRMVSSPEYERAYGTDTVPGRNTRYCGTTF